ncbi:DNA recombination protein RmuC [Candidatus Shapirobacteria bacterium]|nr:DNA recombination protein RmuC [Candidatus Shapirobacteria bacterium]
MAIVYILLVLILITLIYFIFNSQRPTSASLDPKTIDTIINVANEKLGDKSDQISVDLKNKKDSIEKMVNQVLTELDKSQNKLELAEKDRVGSFEGLKTAIENNRKITEQLSVTTEGLKKTLSNNQMRGAFGEKVAEDLLKQSGFVIGVDYTKQESEGSGRPDFTLYLPDKTKINIDSKFPYSAVVKMSETEDNEQKKQYLKEFEKDIKDKINQVNTRDYIDPEKNTVDFVIVFIPNEMIFSFIYEKFPHILDEAFNKKIILTGPFSFTAILRMVRQAYENFRFQKDIRGIIAQIKVFGAEYAKFSEEFNKFGDRINSLQDQFVKVSHTRSNKLQKVIDRIQISQENDEVLEIKEQN